MECVSGENYQSEFGLWCESEETCYQNLSALQEELNIKELKKRNNRAVLYSKSSNTLQKKVHNSLQKVFEVFYGK